MDVNIQQEILERIVRIETKIDSYNSTKEKADTAYNKACQNEKDISEIKDNMKWLWRTIAGAILIGVILAIVKFR
ncbi:hemolysin XhlA family protein [Clostridium sp. ZS2-4]|uniref:hemolysin XhlA family protein n=1 Tax=Clostridium sp. ZS2-4 TaxID=2987703 RepID=UPI00227B8EDF|nr:hemolysin XhlA family protein [Clostridium sp. ZS2-4]MCY6355368.1 hemolysin XhlA family protein [Clostridium sp. ZS2-4]